MTVMNETNSVVYRGNGATTQFPYEFRIPMSAWVTVYLRDYVTKELIEVIVLGQYSITGVSWENYNGGEVTYPLVGDPISDAVELVIERIVPYVQGLDLINQGGFYPQSIENQLDLTTFQIQQLAAAKAEEPLPDNFATVAYTGSYNDLVDLPDLAAVALSGNYEDLLNRPNFGTAAFAATGDFATAAQGLLADSAIQSGDLGSAAFEDAGDFATAAQGGLADSAVQPGDLGALATKNAVIVPDDITASGTPSATTYLRGDGFWATPEGGGGIGGPVYNFLVNGAFNVNQRVFGGGSLAAHAYGYDRWKAGIDPCNISVSGGVITHTSGPIVQVIESPDLANATVTLSVEDLTGGDLNVNIEGETGTITAGVGRRGVTVTVPSGSTGHVTVTLTPASGAVTYRRVQLNEGSEVLPFERRHPAQELALCQRYFEKTYPQGVPPGTSATAGLIKGSATISGSSSAIRSAAGALWQYKVTKRATPSFVIYSTSGSVDGNAEPTTQGQDTVIIRPTVAVTQGDLLTWQVTAAAEL